MPKKSEALKDLAARMNKVKAQLKKVSRSCLDRTLSLISHPNTKLIKLSGRGFRVRGKYYKGLTPVLKDLFWPLTEEDPFKRSKEDVKRRKSRKIYAPSEGKKKVKKCKGFGAKHGSKVHKEVCKLVRRFASNRAVRKIPAGLDPCTLRVINLLAENGWFPIASELGTFDDRSKIATAMDIAVIDVNRSKVIALELKTSSGAEDYGAHPTDTGMSPPMEDVINCPKNRHAMQHMCTILSFENNYGFTFDDAAILRVCPKQRVAKIIPLPEWTDYSSVRASVTSSLIHHKR